MMKITKVLSFLIIGTLVGCTNQTKQDTNTKKNLLNYEDDQIVVVSKKVDNQLKILVKGKSSDALDVLIKDKDKVVETHSSIYQDNRTLFVLDANKYSIDQLKVEATKTKQALPKTSYSVEGLKTNKTDEGSVETTIQSKTKKNVGEIVYIFSKKNTKENDFDDAYHQMIKMDTKKSFKYSFDGSKYKVNLGKDYNIKTYIRLTGAK